MSSNSSLLALENGILQNEGGTAAAGYAVNNPYDLMPGGTLATYPTMAAGEQAGEQQIINAAEGKSPYYDPNESIAQFVQTYTGNGPNAVQNVAAASGLDMSQPLSTVAPNGYGSLDSLSAPTLTPEALGTAAASGSVPANTTAPGLTTTPYAGFDINAFLTSRVVVGVAGFLFVAAGLIMLSLSGLEGAVGAISQSDTVRGATRLAKLAA